MKVKNLVILAFLSAIMLVLQVVMGFLPNIELVSLLVILYTLVLKKKVFYTIYIFAILEGFFYGFGIWWIMYLYVWTILAIITLIFQKNLSPILWAVISGAFGLSYGFLCSLPYFLTLGVTGGMLYWIKGIPFDVTHCIGNIVLALILFKPLYRVLNHLNRRFLIVG